MVPELAFNARFTPLLKTLVVLKFDTKRKQSPSGARGGKRYAG